MSIILSTLNFAEDIRKTISNLQDIDYIINENTFGDYVLFKINLLSNDKSKLEKLRKKVAKIVADLILDNLERKIINRIIDQEYEKELDIEEKEDIKENSKKYLNSKKNEDTGNLLQKDKLTEEIIKYLKQYKLLNIEGFIRFRLKDYINKLKLIVEKSVDNYNVEQEYDEFIKLLRYFVDLQEPKIKTVNLIKKRENSYKVLDSQKNNIKSEYLKDCVKDMLEQDEEFEFEDLIVSALVNISPEKIILHFRDEKIEETLEEIFGEKLTFCQGCEMCTQKLKT